MTDRHGVNLRKTMTDHPPTSGTREIRSLPDHVDHAHAVAFTDSMVIAFPRPLVHPMAQSSAG